MYNLSEHEMKYFSFNQNDIDLISSVKQTAIKSQQYELAANLRDIEKRITTAINQVAKKQTQEEENLSKHNIEFGEFILNNYAPHFILYQVTDKTINEVVGHQSLYAYRKLNDASEWDGEPSRTYTSKEVYMDFLTSKLAKQKPS